MKKSVIPSMVLLLAIMGSACNKDGSKSNDSLVGTWELRQTSAAMMPAPTAYPAGNGNIIRFYANGTFDKFQNAVSVQSGNYRIVDDPTVQQSVCLVFPEGKFTERVVYNDDNTKKTFFELTGDRVQFVEGCYAVDAGHTMEYQRIVNEK